MTNNPVSFCACGEHAFRTIGPRQVVLVDTSKWQFLDHWNWFVHPAGPSHEYCAANICGKRHLLHRLLVNSKGPVDHINGDTLDNRSTNLRAATHAQNVANQKARKGGASRFKGVFRQKKHWACQVSKLGKAIRKSGFASEVEAAREYDRLAIQVHGKFARTNAMLGLLDDHMRAGR